MLEGLKLKDQLPKAIDWGSFCLTDGEALVAQGKRRRKERSEWRAPTWAMKMPKAWPMLASA